MSRTINFISIVVGGLLALYAQSQEKQNLYLLLGGIMLLMFGIYRTSRNIPSKSDKSNDETFVEAEHED